LLPVQMPPQFIGNPMMKLQNFKPTKRMKTRECGLS